MKSVTVRKAREQLARVCNISQRERVVITRNGQPFALVVGVEGKGMEDIALENDPKFWAMIEERRRSAKYIPLEQVERELGKRGHRRPPRR